MSTVSWLRGSVQEAPGRTRPPRTAPSPPTRRLDPKLRAPLAALAVLVAALVGLVAVFAARGSSEPPPATGSAAVVPSDVLAYVHVSTDASRPAVKRATALAARFPDYPLLALGATRRLSTIVGGSAQVDFSADIRPWLGKEAAFALLNTPTATAGSLLVLDVRNRARAEAFLSRSGATPDGTYGRAHLLRYKTGTELAFVRHYLVAGQDASVRMAIDVGAGKGRSLQGDPGYQRASADEPPDRVLDAYASVGGVRRLLAPQGGVLGALGALLYQPALTGTTISLSPDAGGARMRVHSALDPTLARLSGPRPVSFSPTLERFIPPGSTLMLDVNGLDRAAPHVLSAGAAGGVGAGIGPLLRRLGSALAAEGVNVQNILSIFHGETAVALMPASAGAGAGGGSSAGAAVAGGASSTASLLILARTRDEAATRTTLASLEGPLTQLFPAPAAGPGQAPELSDRQIGGISVHQIGLGPGLQLDYAVFDGLVAVSTSIDSLAAVIARSHSLASAPDYRAVLGNRAEQVTSLLFLDFGQLLGLGRQIGLGGGARFSALLPDLEKIRAIGLYSTHGESDATTELSFRIP